jgi:hypothetical protein
MYNGEIGNLEQKFRESMRDAPTFEKNISRERKVKAAYELT